MTYSGNSRSTFNFSFNGFYTPPPRMVLPEMIINGQRRVVPMQQDEWEELQRRAEVYLREQARQRAYERQARYYTEFLSEPLFPPHQSTARETWKLRLMSIAGVLEYEGEDLKPLLRAAYRKAHPDHGGTNELFREVTDLKQKLNIS